jgi:hypothetical protein
MACRLWAWRQTEQSMCSTRGCTWPSTIACVQEKLRARLNGRKVRGGQLVAGPGHHQSRWCRLPASRRAVLRPSTQTDCSRSNLAIGCRRLRIAVGQRFHGGGRSTSVSCWRRLSPVHLQPARSGLSLALPIADVEVHCNKPAARASAPQSQRELLAKQALLNFKWVADPLEGMVRPRGSRRMGSPRVCSQALQAQIRSPRGWAWIAERTMRSFRAQDYAAAHTAGIRCRAVCRLVSGRRRDRKRASRRSTAVRPATVPRSPTTNPKRARRRRSPQDSFGWRDWSARE